MDKNSVILDVNYYWYETIRELLDSVWNSLLCKYDIPPYRYITTWLLQDSKTRRIFDDIGIGSRYGGREDYRYIKDKRILKDVGINPGIELLIIPRHDI